MTKDLHLDDAYLSTEQVEAIAKAKETLKSYGYLVESLWSKADIVSYISNYPEEYPLLSALPKDELEEVIDSIAEAIEDNFDADLGINWDVIGYAVSGHEEALREQLVKGDY